MVEEDLITVKDFAFKYRVDQETVRSWVKQGHINYVLIGTRKMIRKSDLLKPVVQEEEDPVV